MTGTCQTRTLVWRGITLNIRYGPTVAGLANFQIESDGHAPFPGAASGITGRLCDAEHIEAMAGPVAFLIARLDHAATHPEWKRLGEASRQLSLFWGAG